MKSFIFLISFIFSVSLMTGQNRAVTWSVDYDKAALKPGNQVTVTFTGRIADGYKVYSLSQKAEGLAAFGISVAPDKKAEGCKMTGLREKSPSLMYHDELMNADIQYTEKKIVIEQDFQITGNNPVLKGQLIYTFFDENRNNQRKAYSFTLR